LGLTPSPLAVLVSTFGVAGEETEGGTEVILDGVVVEIVGFFSARKDRQGLPEHGNGKARTWLRRGRRVVFRCAAGSPFGLFDIVLPLFYNILRCLGHTLVRMRSQLSDGETSLTFLWSDITRLVGGGVETTEIDGSP